MFYALSLHLINAVTKKYKIFKDFLPLNSG